MEGLIVKKTEKLDMGWSIVVQIVIVLLWKVSKRVLLPVALRGQGKGAAYIAEQNRFHFEKKETKEYGENSYQTKLKKMSIHDLLQVLFEELKKLGEV